jgi:hypothetical protein
MYGEAKKAVESARVGLSLLDGTRARSRRFQKKKAKEATKKALAKAQDSKPEAKEADEATEMNDNTMKAGFQEDLEKAKQAQGIAKGAMTAATSKMFMFYSNLLSLESKYAWNKIVSKHLTTVSCFTFSLHFPSMQLSKKSTTSQMYLRSPSTSMYPSLYVV